MSPGTYTFFKAERLCSKLLIEELFTKGSSVFIYPFKVFYLYTPHTSPHVQVLFSVPKKKFKKAVDRNYIKRRMREAYRLNKNILTNQNRDFAVAISFVYVAVERHDFAIIQEKLILCLERLKGTLNTQSDV